MPEDFKTGDTVYTKPPYNTEYKVTDVWNVLISLVKDGYHTTIPKAWVTKVKQV